MSGTGSRMVTVFRGAARLALPDLIARLDFSGRFRMRVPPVSLLGFGAELRNGDGLFWHGIQYRKQPARLGAAKTEHPLFPFVLLNCGFQGLDRGCLPGFLRSDGVPGDVLSVPGAPLELHALHCKDTVKMSQGSR